MGNVDELARLMGYDGKSDEVSLGYGLVTAISESYVTCDYKGATIDAVKCCNPNVGDIVAIEAQGGQTRAIAVKGGEHHEQPEQTYIYDTVINNMNWTVQRTGDFVQAWGRDTKSESASSSSAYRNDTFTLPVAFDTGSNLGFNAHLSYTTIWCKFLQPTAYARTTLGAYVGIEGGHGSITYARQLYVAGRSTSDYETRVSSATSGSIETFAINGREMHLVGNGTQIAMTNARLQTMTIPAGTYEIGLDCADRSAEGIYIDGEYHMTGIDVRRSLETFVVLGSASSALSNALALSRVNGIPLDSTMEQAMPNLNNVFALEEPTEVKWYAYLVDPAGVQYDLTLIPWIRRIA